MRTAVKMLLLMQSASVQERALILGTQPSNLIGYWPLGDTSGTTADDLSATDANGTYTGTYTLNQPGIGDGSPSVLFAGGRVSLATPINALNAVFTGSAGTVFLYYKVSAAGVWTDGVARFMFEIGADANNRIILSRQSVNNALQFTSFFGGTQKGVFPTGQSTTAWQTAALTWDKAGDAVKGYLNGTQFSSTQTGLGTFTGALSSSFSAIGDFTSAGSANAWSGYLAHIAVWKVALSAAEILALSPSQFLV